jgi:hypothetical protein
MTFKTPIAIVALAATLGGCATGGTTLTPSSLQTTLSQIVADIQGFAEVGCGFQPDITTVENIITSFYPGAALISVPEQAIANTICSVVPPKPATPAATVALSARLRAGSPILYPGTSIEIHGTYVKRSLGRHHRA